jgi:hypothetical protein
MASIESATGLKNFVREHEGERCGIFAHTDELAAFLFVSLGRPRFGWETGLGLVGIGDRPVTKVGISTVKLDVAYWADAWMDPISKPSWFPEAVLGTAECVYGSDCSLVDVRPPGRG